jgi:hypothetical protein
MVSESRLQEEIDLARKDIRTDSYSVSIGEWISIYESSELDIHPEFQRFFRWSAAQKSRLIESLLLGIPIPPIFVSQREDGVWDVVDGLQRLSTIYQFVGILKDEKSGRVDPLILEGTEYLPSLEGRRWDSHGSQEKSESEGRTKYELFQRLNTGGTHLSDQEVRNAILVMLNREFFEWIGNLSRYQAFVECTALSDRALEERYDMELALRFLALRRLETDELSGIGDLGDFLTSRAREMAENSRFPMEAEGRVFESTFDTLNQATQSEAFRRFDPARGKHVGGFLVSAFEAVALGVGFNPEKAIRDEELSRRIRNMWSDRDFTESSGSGVRAGSRIPKVVPFGRRRFQSDG